MQRTATLPSHPVLTVTPSRWRAWLRQAWHDLAMDVDERFLRQACDLADLERRQRYLERGRPERFSPFDRDA